MNDSVLIVWIIVSTVWDIIVFGFTAYLVFWKGHSGWWFIFAILLTSSTTLFKALKNRYKIEDDEE